MKWAFRIFGAGVFLFGASSYFIGIPLPIRCQSAFCTLGTTIVTADMAMMGIGLLLMVLSYLMVKNRK